MSIYGDNYMDPDDHAEMENVSEYVAFSITDLEEDGMMSIEVMGTDTVIEGSLLDRVGTKIHNVLETGNINNDIAFNNKEKGMAMITLEANVDENDIPKIDINCLIDPPAKKEGVVTAAQGLTLTAIFSIQDDPSIGIENIRDH